MTTSALIVVFPPFVASCRVLVAVVVPPCRDSRWRWMGNDIVHNGKLSCGRVNTVTCIFPLNWAGYRIYGKTWEIQFLC